MAPPTSRGNSPFNKDQATLIILEWGTLEDPVRRDLPWWQLELGSEIPLRCGDVLGHPPHSRIMQIACSSLKGLLLLKVGRAILSKRSETRYFSLLHLFHG